VKTGAIGLGITVCVEFVVRIKIVPRTGEVGHT
jgi:hypothetical protein